MPRLQPLWLLYGNQLKAYASFQKSPRLKTRAFLCVLFGPIGPGAGCHLGCDRRGLAQALRQAGTVARGVVTTAIAGQ